MLETNKELLRKEGIEFDAAGIVFLSKIKAIAGSIIITPVRLAFYTSGSPLAGVLLKVFFKKLGPHVSLSIPYKDIKEIKPTQVGINKKMFEVVLISGKSYKFGCNKKEFVDQYISALKEKMNKHEQ